MSGRSPSIGSAAGSMTQSTGRRDDPGATISALPHRTTPLSPIPGPSALPSADRVARLRPMTTAAVFGGLVGLAIGAAYLGGTAARANTVRGQAERIQVATSAGFTEEALSAAAGGLDSGALAVARRHDPYTVAGGAQRDRQSALLTARLEQLRGAPAGDLRRISLTAGPSVQPFRLANAIDDSRDLDCLTQAAYYEARGEGADGMRAVTQVVLNRVRHAAFPNSICGVVFQGAARRTGCQFSFTCDGSMRGPVNRAAWSRAREVATRALSGYVYAPVGAATHFHTTQVSPAWRGSLIQVTRVGQHLFYRFGGRAGSSAAFTYAARPSSSDDQPQLVQAGLDPVETARQAGQAVAYTLLLAQEGRNAPDRAQDRTQAEPAEAAPAPAAAKPTAPTPATANPGAAPA